MIDFGVIELYENETVSFALPWQGSQDPDSFGFFGWKRLNQPLKVQARRGNRKNADVVADLEVLIEDSEIYGTDGALVLTFPGEITESDMRFDIISADGFVYARGLIRITRRVTE